MSASDSSDAEIVDGHGELGFSPPSGGDAELDPVVELWYELTEHMKDEDISHPSEFYTEKNKVAK